MKTKLKIAVRTLIEHVLRAGDLELEFLSSSRPVEAIRAHQKIQKSRPENYIFEVPITYQWETDRFLLEINGRIDGVYCLRDEKNQDRVIVDEIKTTTRTLDFFKHHENTRHWGQVKLYAYIYAVEQGLDEIETQLTYYQMDTGETLEINRSFVTDELKTFFQEIIARYLEWADAMANWHQLRDQSIRTIGFPFNAFRPGQRKMAVEVYRTIKNNSHLIVQAATGIGKTMAALFPSVKAIAEGLHSKIFYLTARTTGQAAAEKALDELRIRGLRMKSLTLTAKDKICPNPENACTADECEFARGHYDRIDDALNNIFRQDAFTRIAISETAETYRVCPFEFSLELSMWADCIICDYNYAFDPRVFLRGLFLNGNEAYTFLIDEAHNLAERSREMFSAEIWKQAFLDVRRSVLQALPQVYKSIGKINSWLVEARKKCEASGSVLSQKEPPNDLFPLLRNFLRITERWLSMNMKQPFRDGLLNLYFDVSGFLKVAEQYDERYVSCFEQIKKNLRLKLFCLDPSDQLTDALQRCQAAVFFSATMTPVDYFKKILGCDTSAGELSLPSPFPDRNLGIFIADRISTLYRDRNRTIHAISLTILSFVRQKTGNYLLFFPSYEYMLMIHGSFVENSPETETIVQTYGMKESDRDSFLERFGGKNPATLVGFAVMGGIFGEGIDLVGERLCGVVIVGVGLPGISPERELIREYFTEYNRSGFEYAYLYLGLNRVLQAAGRLIRSEKDRGTVLLIDQRFTTFRYKSLFPRQWHPVTVKDAVQFEKALNRFWTDTNRFSKFKEGDPPQAD
ncbi:MAG: ATP-dependent DNA helicase [Deltaproteobacteria bacterium]|nr:ATP-dependent DNA helicase [Deltaproteobacteria bacterium]